LRIAEDKGIESYGVLQKESQKSSVYKRLNRIFSDADEKYNAGLFKHEKWLEKITIDDKILCNIITSLYFPECPYALAVLPVEILGNIYEKFLGKVIRLTAGHRVKVEEKPEVRKAGGVFYTPQYIVDYIVQNTVGVLINNKTPDEISAMTIVDPACGSGSFLVGAYQFLLNYHLDFYTKEPNKKSALKRDKIFESASQTYKLTIAEKQRILQNNIFGVDIDSQAVEVTKLSLYLKLLENEGKESEGQLFSFTDLRLLPDIENNIKCGNSLIGTDFFAQRNFNLPEEEQLKINCFDWEKEFANVFRKNGGFDVVIGNPPYVRNRILDGIQKDYFAQKYKSAKGQFDLYQLFYENGIKIIRAGGSIGFITSNKFAITDYGKELRNVILDTCKIRQIIDVSNISVFKQASTYPYIFILEKSKNNSNNQIKYAKIQHFDELQNIRLKKISQAEYKNSINNSFILRVFPAFFKRINNQSIKLNEIASIKETIHTGNIRDKFVTNKKSGVACKKLLFGKDVHRYKIKWNGNYIRYDKKLIDKTKGEYANLCNEKYFEKPKILLREIAYNIEAVFDEDHFYTLNKLYSIQLFDNISYDYLFLLGILNSKLMSYYFRESFEEAHVRGGYLQFKKIYTSQIPIIKLDLNIPTDKTLHDHLVSIVDKMLQLKHKEHAEQKPQMKTILQRQIIGLDQEIDRTVYLLYDLTEEEIKIVEGT
jgi:hypothetical protein